MTTIIKDGTGTGLTAKVDGHNRIQTFSTGQTEVTHASKEGNAYTMSSGVINLTSDNESAILYFKSNESSQVAIHEIRVSTGVSNATGDVIRIDYIRPTTGTLITDAVAVSVNNLNTASASTLDAVVYSGGEGKTIGGEVASGQDLHHLSQVNVEQAGFIVPKGASLGLTITPPTGNTSMNVQVSVIVYIID